MLSKYNHENLHDVVVMQQSKDASQALLLAYQYAMAKYQGIE